VDQLTPSNNARRRLKLAISEDVRTIYFNPSALKLILINLIENALAYSPSNSEVAVSAVKAVDKRSSTSDELIKIEIADSGAGIPEDYLQKIFNPFVRVPSGKKEGSGLGLTLVRSLVELYGGSVSIRNREDRGTVVYIMLPDLKRTSSEL
jgi:two-component system OmpR family sensor kinase/two-component system sensor histidine kinase QseC